MSCTQPSLQNPANLSGKIWYHYFRAAVQKNVIVQWACNLLHCWRTLNCARHQQQWTWLQDHSNWLQDPDLPGLSSGPSTNGALLNGAWHCSLSGPRFCSWFVQMLDLVNADSHYKLDTSRHCFQRRIRWAATSSEQIWGSDASHAFDAFKYSDLNPKN